jgi:hypothetical protein
LRAAADDRENRPVSSRDVGAAEHRSNGRTLSRAVRFCQHAVWFWQHVALPEDKVLSAPNPKPGADCRETVYRVPGSNRRPVAAMGDFMGGKDNAIRIKKIKAVGDHHDKLVPTCGVERRPACRLE